MKKKMIAGVLAFALVFGLAACGSSGNDKDPENGQKPGTEQGVGDEDEDGAASGGAIDSPENEDGQDNGSGTDGTQQPSQGSGTGNSAGKPSGSQSGAQKPGGSGTGSGSTGTTSKAPISGSFEDIIKKIYEKVGYDVSTSFTEVTADNAEYYLGTSGISFKKALASEPMMSSIAHSVVLLEAEDGADLKDIKKKIKENVDGRKWVCVGVEDEDILVGNVGNYVLLVMDEDSQDFMDAFLAMGK